MDGISQVYCDAAIQAILLANREVCNTLVETLLKETRYGKSDTLGLDAIPEIVIKEQLERFDQESVLFTEELASEQRMRVNPRAFSYPVICIADPTDRSSFLRRFLEALDDKDKRLKFQDIISRKETEERWNGMASGPAIISGPTSAITIVRNQRVLFSVIVNYLTQHIFVVCEKGMSFLDIDKTLSLQKLKALDLATILKRGESIKFDLERDDWPYDAGQNHVTFLGKTLYGKTFEDIGLPFSGRQRLIYSEPGGASRILYLSSLYQEREVGFVLANGEKIIEWIHWLPYLALTRGSECPLRIFEIALDRPWTKDGVLMATSPTYSIFERCNGKYLLDVAHLLSYENPSRYRSTILVTYTDNLWAIQAMEGYQHRELFFSF